VDQSERTNDDVHRIIGQGQLMDARFAAPSQMIIIDGAAAELTARPKIL